ncbi:MAG: hypothetical protein U1D41_09245 [Nitrosomonas sp.]|uniref:dCTP deaminase n=1 Tax=Nitrosomonas sp. TaxID=42353 RepID=UPI00273384C7|nr:hypothetical protein [Nitrosomonas sp.]MDP3279603.1 hypothetical protein [Nitrosomonas sp.]MDP3662727.1 hypothetical protein [Nitrosomonas sp.]MDZ4106329.1 hypothetical protein [Nitrosomonas sp.]
MSILSDSQIRALVKKSILIEEFNENHLQPASYDMCVGEEFVYHGKLSSFSSTIDRLHLEPGDFALLSTHEILNMPETLVGHNGLMSPWAKMGLISLFSPQIDPGFEGKLIVPVVNLGNEPISIVYHKPMFTVEFEEMNEAASVKWINIPGNKRQISMQGIRIPAYIKPMTLGANEINDKLKRLEEQVSKLQMFAASVKGIAAVVAVVIAALKFLTNVG